MNAKFLLEMKNIRRNYTYFPKEFETSFRNGILYIFNYGEIPYNEEELSLIEKYVKASNPNDIIKETLINEYAQMQPKEIIENVFDFIRKDCFEKEILEAIPKNIDILDYIEPSDKNINNTIFNQIEIEKVINYINEDKINKKNIIKLLADLGPIDEERWYSIVRAYKIITRLNSDKDRASMTLQTSFIDRDKAELLHTIKNSYYRNLIRKQTSEYDYKASELLKILTNLKI